MERLHAEDKPERVDVPPQRRPAAAQAQATVPSPAPAALSASTPAPNSMLSSATVAYANAASPAPAAARPARPPGARPHRNHEDDEAPAPRAPGPSLAERWSAFHTMWLAGAIALVSALGVAASAERGGDPLLPALIAVPAILLVVLAPMAMAGEPGEAAR